MTHEERSGMACTYNKKIVFITGSCTKAVRVCVCVHVAFTSPHLVCSIAVPDDQFPVLRSADEQPTDNKPLEIQKSCYDIAHTHTHTKI